MDSLRAGLSHRESLIGGVVCKPGFADPRPGCHTGCRWRCRLLCVDVWLGFADPRPGCHTGCRWRCNLLICGLRVRADPRPGCRRTACRWRCNLLMCGGVSCLQIYRALSRRVSLEVSIDACNRD